MSARDRARDRLAGVWRGEALTLAQHPPDDYRAGIRAERIRTLRECADALEALPTAPIDVPALADDATVDLTPRFHAVTERLRHAPTSRWTFEELELVTREMQHDHVRGGSFEIWDAHEGIPIRRNRQKERELVHRLEAIAEKAGV